MAFPARGDYALLSSLSETTAAARDLGELQRSLAAGAQRGLGAARSGLVLVEADGQLRVVGGADRACGTDRAWLRLLTDPEGPAAAAVLTGTTVDHREPASLAGATPHLAAALAACGLHRLVALPLRGHDRLAGVLGVLVLAWDVPGEPVAGEGVVLLTAARWAAQALQRCLLVDEDRLVARTLQEAMLTPLPEPDHLLLAARYLPAATGHRVGGDWYDALVLPSGHTAVAIGDVTGHDLEAAAAMGQMRSMLRGFAVVFGEPPARVLGQLDSALAHLRLGAHATAVLMAVEQDADLAARGEHRLRWASAGHLPPLLLGPSGAELLQTPPDIMLGVTPDAVRHDHERTAPAGSTVVLYTDGLVERRGSDLARDLARLPATAAPLAGLPPEDLLDGLLEAVAPDGEDDVALLALRLGDPPAR